MDCAAYEDVNDRQFMLGVLLIFGVYASYLPQHWRIWKRRTSEGLSPYYLLLGSASAFSCLVNLVLVTVPARECCRAVLSSYQCTNSLMGLFQMTAQAAGYILILVLCVYITRDSPTEPSEQYAELDRNYHIFLGYALVNTLFGLYLVYTKGMGPVSAFANFSGMLSAVLATIQYIPQIYTTYLLKHSGSLSIEMMCIQIPGGLLWSYSLYANPGSKWSSWLPIVTAAALQSVVLTMCIYYKFREATTTSPAPVIGAADDENTPLV